MYETRGSRQIDSSAERYYGGLRHVVVCADRSKTHY